ncbi:MAG: cysteine desulfurase family protein [Methylovulum sp.]|uniref:cysteine desulfurase family protein n=1 Tax=Methylovulum sp. TaxID=1916980 RepID=UPI00261D3978|nr:cysteine desulfurase family protein [Methylovulum sp.]MDD2725139.1 cysteine desulfurase family protein [Methylovulum sp.]MDD5125409.1 cysteine desulfurase family protein [Methylovulum sp.]
MIYLDHNATTPLDGRVVEAMLPFLKSFYGNPSSLYRHGRLARSALDTAREQVAALVDANPAAVIFTSGGTEANNLALASLPAACRLAIAATEHPSITEPAKRLSRQGHGLSIIAVDGNGLLTEAALSQLMGFQPTLVSLMLANNETGVVQDVAAYAGQWRESGIIVHTDAVQAAGKIPVSFKRLGVQMLSLSSHKIYGPKGCGALVFDKSVPINPLIVGGGQEQDLRSGTENVAAIVGFGKAAELAKTELAERGKHLLGLRTLLEANLEAIPGLSMFAKNVNRLPNTVQFGIDGVDGEMLLMKLDKKNIAVSSGSACASGGGQPSPVLMAMGVNPTLAKSAIRISLGIANTEAEIVQFIHVVKDLVSQA